MALQGFDKDYYLQAKLDALVASSETEWVGKDADFLEAVLVNVYGLTPEDHYSQYGYAEGLAPNACFNAAEYSLAKATQLFNAGLYMTIEDAQADYEAKWPGDDYQHYLQYGSAEGVNPSNAFDESSYYETKLAALQADADPATADEWADKTVDDVQAAFTAAGLTALGHYIAYGQDEGIAVTPVPADEQVNTSDLGVVGETFILTTGLDNVVGTANDDTVLALVDGDDDTLSLGDTIDAGQGNDTLKIIAEDEFSLSSLTLSNIEVLDITTAADVIGLPNIDLDDNAFDTVLVTAKHNIDLDNVVASSVMDIDVKLGADVDVDFSVDTTSTTANIAANITSSIDGGSNSTIDLEYDFTAATTVNSTMNFTDLISAESYTDIYETVNLSQEDVVFNHILNMTNIDTVDDSTYGDYYLELNQEGGVTYNGTMTLTDVDDMYIEIDIDNDSNGVSSNNVLNVTLDNVQNSNEETQIYLDEEIQTVNMTVVNDSELYYYDNYEGDADSVHAWNITANADLTIDNLDLNDSGEVNVTITGAGNIDFGSADDITTLDASTATGDIVITSSFDSDATTITTGSGNDSIIVGSDETAVSTGDGDDAVDANGYDFGLDDDSATIDGGDGTDTIAIDDGADADTAYMANILNFETLEIAGGTGIYEMDNIDLTDIKLTNAAIVGATTLNDAAAGAALAFTATSDADATVDLTAAGLSYALEDATGTSDSLSITLNANDTGTDRTAHGQVTAALVANGIETVSVESNATTASEESAAGEDDQLTEADYTNTFTLIADDAETINLSGDAMIDLTVGADDAGVGTIENTAVTFVDASANTAGVTVDMSAIDTDANGATDDIAVNTSAVSFNGTNAADTYTASHNGDIIQGNGGADAINLSYNGTLTVATDADETVRYVAATDSQLTLEDTSDPADDEMDTATGFDVINDFGSAGTDIIELSSLLGLATGDSRSNMLQLGTITAGVNGLADDLDTFIGDGVDFFDDNLSDRATAFADYGIDGYLFIDANSDGDFTQADDMVINLAGVTSLAITDISFG